MPPSVIAVADHTGWAHVVCVSARDGRPCVVARQRIALIESGLPTQAYEHATRGKPADEAEALIAKVRDSVTRTTDLALGRLIAGLAAVHPPAALAIRQPPFDELPASVAEAHASYRLQCSADGVLYNLAIRRTAERLGLDVRLHRRGDEFRLAAAALDTTPEAVDAFVSGRKVLTITDGPDSPLASNSQVQLYVDAGAASAFQPISAAIGLVQALVTAVGQE